MVCVFESWQKVRGKVWEFLERLTHGQHFIFVETCMNSKNISP